MAPFYKVILVLTLLFLAVDAKVKDTKDKDDKGKDQKGKNDKDKDEKGKDDKGKDHKGKDDKAKDNKAKDDKAKDDKGKHKKQTASMLFPKIPKAQNFPFPGFEGARKDVGKFPVFDGVDKDVGKSPVFDDDQKDVGKSPVVDDAQEDVGKVPVFEGAQEDVGVADAKPDFETDDLGSWEIINPQSGVSAMQIILMPTNKILVYDATVYRTSRLPYPKGMPCVPWFNENLKQQVDDCFAHSMEYDIETNQVRALTVKTDPWCSCGGLTPDGTLLVAGGFADGVKTARYYGGQADCKNCDWREYPNKLQEPRWYATQTLLANGEYIVIGGRRSFSYEFFPKEGQASAKPYFFPFLYETSDIDENNLYPFVHLSSDGNLFIFANNRSLLLNPTTNKVVRTYPVLPGGSRNYPASGMSTILPITLDGTEQSSASIKIEVLVCGGNTHDSFYIAESQKIFIPSVKDCSRMVITDPKPQWDSEEMPSGRCMGDSLNLPNGQILFINGAQKGTAAWWDADDPNFTPVLYWPYKPKGQRFKVLKPTQIARMYHSTSAVLPNGKIWVGGSNTHDTYRDVDKFPTETRIEAFSPPYLDPNLDKYRPQIVKESFEKNMKYGNDFGIEFKIQDMTQKLTNQDIKVTMYYPPFTTHGYSMNQRLLFLKTSILPNSEGTYKIVSKAPAFREVAPPGYYLIFVVHRGVPSKGMWVKIV